MKLVGSVNGLVCLGGPPLGQTVIVWNPALNLKKTIRLPIPVENTYRSELGFAYDSDNDDYNIIRIDFLLRSSPGAFFSSRAEVYSVSLDSWKRVHIDFHFFAPVTRSLVTVNGIPYWLGAIYQPNNEFQLAKMLIDYDMRNGSFKHVSLPDQDRHAGKQYVEWKGNLSRIVSRGDFVDIWVYDEMGMCWNKISSYGPIGLKMERPMQCSRDGVILAKTPEGKLMLYDPMIL